MPTYEYECAKCDEHFEVYQSFSDEPLKRHKGCGGKLSKVFGSVGIVLKGSGFYKTDNGSRSKAGASTSGSDGSGSSDSSAGSNGSDSSSGSTETSGASDRKPDKKSDSTSDSKSASSTKSSSKSAKNPSKAGAGT